MALNIQVINRFIDIETHDVLGNFVFEILPDNWFTATALTIIVFTGKYFILSTSVPLVLIVGSVMGISSCLLIFLSIIRYNQMMFFGGPNPFDQQYRFNQQPNGEREIEQFTNRLLQFEDIEPIIDRLLDKHSFLEEREGILNQPLQESERELVSKRLIQALAEDLGIKLSPSINPAHLAHSLQCEGSPIFIPQGCNLSKIRLSSLVDLFDAMNITEPLDTHLNVRADYVDSSRIVVADSEGSLNYDDARKNIVKLVDRINNCEYMLGISSNDRARQEDFIKLETLLKVIIYEIQSKHHDAAMCNDIILQCAIAVGHCSARYMAVLSEGYGKLVERVVCHSFKDLVLEEFHKLRKLIVTHITYTNQRGRGVEQPHVLHRHMINLGPVRGIRDTQYLDFSDVFTVSIAERSSLRAFDSIYTAQYIQACFEEMVNGVQIMEEEDPSSNLLKFIDTDSAIGTEMTIEWLGDHVPPEWHPSIQHATGSIELDCDQIESLFGPSFDTDQRKKSEDNPRYQELTGSDRLEKIRSKMFQIACITTVEHRTVKSVACTYILDQLGVLHRNIDWTQLHMNIDVLRNVFLYDDDDLNRAHIEL